MKMIEDMKSDFFQTPLQTRGNIAISFGQRLVFVARRSKRLDKLIRENLSNHGRAFVPTHFDALGMMPEVFEVELESPVGFGANDVTEDFDVVRPAVRRQTHDLAFITIMRKSQKLGGGGVDDPGRVRVLDLVHDRN